MGMIHNVPKEISCYVQSKHERENTMYMYMDASQI